MPGDQVKRSSVKLSTLPVGRKFLMIRDGKQLLMLKALGGSRSVYSIEEKGTPRTGITRSGKRHFQFSLPKFVNDLEVMNDHSQKSDHVADQNLHSVKLAKPKRGHFAKKSTSNNLKHPITRHKGTPAGKTGPQHSKQTVSSSAKKTLHNALDSANQTSSSRAPNRDVQSETLRSARSESNREEGPTERLQTVKEIREEKASEMGVAPAKERQTPAERVGNERSEPSTQDSVKSEKASSEAVRDVKKGKQNLANKENDPKLKETKVTKGLPPDKIPCKQKVELTEIKQANCLSTGGKESNDKEQKEIETTDMLVNASSSKLNRLLPVQSGIQNSTTKSSKTTDKHTSVADEHSPKHNTDLKRQRASTPTPESPLKKSMLERHLRKRHRSASPVALTSSLLHETKLDHKLSLSNQMVKPNRESIKLDSKNFEKVKNACKNAMSQRKEKTNMDKGSSEPLKTQVKSMVGSDGTLRTATATVKRRIEESDSDLPPLKKRTASKADVQEDISENNNVTSVRCKSSESEDGLTKLMKDFQSAMSSPSLKCNENAISKPLVKGNLRYVSKRTSGHLHNKSPKKIADAKQVEKEPVKAKDAACMKSAVEHLQNKLPKKVAGVIEQVEKESVRAKATAPTKSAIGRIQAEINALQPEDISSDEDFESSQEERGNIPSQGSPKISNNGDIASKEQLSATNSSPKENTLVVDTNRFPSDGHNSSQGVVTFTKGLTQLSKNLIEQGDVERSKSLVTVPQSDYPGNSSGLMNNEDPLPVAMEQKGDAKIEQNVVAEESETSQEKRKKIDLATDMDMMSVKSEHTQTESVLGRKVMLEESTVSKPELKDQSVQFCSITNSVDPEEITPIVAAMFESECEEKERLKKALEDKIGKEEKWRNMVKDLCRQLRELRQQIAKKEPEKHVRNIGVNTIVETSALPVIMSTQASQTEHSGGGVGSSSVSSKPDSCQVNQVNSKGVAKVPTEQTNLPQQSIKSTVVPASATVHHHGPQNLKASTSSPSKVIVPDERVTNVPINLTVSVPSQSSQPGVPNGTKVTEKSGSTEVIDLTDSEDVNTSKPTPQAKKTPTQPRTTVTSQGLPVTSHKFHPATSKPNTFQSNSKYLTNKDQVQATVTRAVTSQGVLPQVPSLRQMHLEKTVPTIIRTSTVSSAQSNQRSVPNRQIPSQFPITSVNRTSAPVVTQLLTNQPKHTVPPPLQPAPTIAASLYTKPPNSQVPMLSPTLGMLVRTQAPQRQDVVLSGVSQQVVQHHGLTPLQQQQVKGTVLLEEFKRGMLQPGLPNYQGSTSIILPSASHQMATLPVRLPQAPPQIQTLQGKKVVLDEKRDGLQRPFQQTHQVNAQKSIGNASQLKAVLSEVEGNGKVQLQGYRNFKVTSSPSGSTSQAQRLPPPPGYTTTSAVQPLNEIHTSTVRTQPANGVQQREVVNGVKQFIPLTSLNTQGTPRNTVATERTWFPNPRQGEVASQGNTSQHVVYVNSKSPSKHPAPLPVLHVSSNIVGRRVLLPSPSIRISHSPEGVVLSWNITTNQDHPTVKKYYLYAYQVLNTPPSTSHWKRIGEVGALPPPMACTLNQFQPGSTYFLAICAVDVYDIPGLFSKTEEVVIPR